MTALGRPGFNGLYKHLFGKATPSESLLNWSPTAKVMDVGYRPGEGLFSGDCLNTWRKTPLVPRAGEWPLIAELLASLFPDDADREHVLAVFAFVAQYPGRKVRHALHVRGPQGTGKNTLFCDILRPIVGAANFQAGDGSALDGRWIDWLLDRQVVLIDEVLHHGGWDIQNRLKPLITEETVVAESKNVDFAVRTTAKVYIILSNSENHLPIEPGDRRAWVPAYGSPPREPAFYERLHAVLPTEIPGFFEMLLSRDISAFRPDAPPPMTEAKMQIISDCKPPLERQLAEMMEDRQELFTRDLVVVADVVMALRTAGFTGTNDDQVRRALRNLGCRQCRP